jgi:hypothetical protein
MGNSQRINVGTAILVDRMTAALIKEQEIITEGRVQYLTLHLPDNTELSIINTYAPRTSRDRALCGKKSAKQTSKQTTSSLAGTSITRRRRRSEVE